MDPLSKLQREHGSISPHVRSLSHGRDALALDTIDTGARAARQSPQTASSSLRATPEVNVLTVVHRKARETMLLDEDWEDKREVIMALYPKMKLEDLIVIMRDQYGLEAKRHMYNRRIRKWGIQKNFKASEKQAIANFLKTHKSGMNIEHVPQTLLARVQRYVKSQEKITQDASHDQALSHSSTSLNNGPNLAMKLSVEAKDLDNYFGALAIYQCLTQWKFVLGPLERESALFISSFRKLTLIDLNKTEFRGEADLEAATMVSHPLDGRLNTLEQLWHGTGIPMRFSVLICDALELSDSDNQAHIVRSVNEACASAADLLRMWHWTAALYLFDTLQKLWAYEPTIARMVIDFLTKMTATILPSLSDCITQSLLLFADLAPRPGFRQFLQGLWLESFFQDLDAVIQLLGRPWVLARLIPDTAEKV